MPYHGVYEAEVWTVLFPMRYTLVYFCMVSFFSRAVLVFLLAILKFETRFLFYIAAPVGSLTAFFQLRLRPVNCVVWTVSLYNYVRHQVLNYTHSFCFDIYIQGSDREGKFAAIITEVARVVRESCFCNFTSANVIANVFSCITSTDEVVFKAELIYADTVSGDELVQVISQWADGMPSIIYDGTLLSVDPTCPTELESLFAEDCVASSQPSVTAITAGVTIGVIGGLLIAIIIAVIVVTLLALRRRSQSHQLT